MPQNPQTRIWIGCGALVLAGILCWWSPRRPLSDRASLESTSTGSFDKNEKTEEVTPLAGPSPAGRLPGASGEKNSKGGARLLDVGSLLRGQIPRPTREELEAFLRAHPKDARAALGVARVTDDPEWIRQLASSYPEDPALQWMLANRGPESAREDAIEAICHLDSQNALGPLLRAASRMKAGDFPAALDALSRAGALPKFDGFREAIFESMVAVYESCRFSQEGAEMLASTQLLSAFTDVAGVVNGQFNKLKRGENPALDTFRSAEPAQFASLAQGLLQLSQRIPAPPILLDELLSANLRLFVSEFASEGASQEALQQAQAVKAKVSEISLKLSGSEGFGRLTNQQLVEYMRVVRAKGEREAFRQFFGE